MKCMRFLQALSEPGIRSPPGSTTGHLDTEKACPLSLSLGTGHVEILDFFFFPSLCA